MTDRRRWPFDGTTALADLRGRVDAACFVAGDPAQVIVPVTGLRATPGGALDRELLFGEPVTRIAEHGAWTFLRCTLDGYVGYAETPALGDLRSSTHLVTARQSHLYAGPGLKTGARQTLSFGSRLQVTGEDDGYAATPDGWVPLRHLTPLGSLPRDPAAMAERFLGTPYLWGGNSGSGIDCSGLVQLAFLACGLSCPRDSDMQEAEVGTALPADAALRRGDLVFWSGHVGMMLDPVTVIHANAWHMAVAAEPLAEAEARILAREFGPITARRRP